MKKTWYILFMLLNQTVFGQYDCTMNFEGPYACIWDGYTNDTAWIDTVDITGQTWQIGEPQKALFNSAYSPVNAMVTKLDTPYPSGDTASFIIRQIVSRPMDWPNELGLSGYYKMNADSLNDVGLIEFSPDNGHLWINLMHDTVVWDSPKPVFTGTISEWTYFSIFLNNIAYAHNVETGDTICFRFTFISDSIQTNKDGWMLDDIGFNFVGEGVAEHNRDGIRITVSPNPFTDFFELNLSEPLSNVELTIYDLLARPLYSVREGKAGSFRVPRDRMISGIYYYGLKSNGKLLATGKLIAD